MKKTFNILLIYFLCLVSFVANIKNVSATNISSINGGDLVRSLDSSAVYLIQNGERKVFPHSSVYLSWGYPADFSTVKTITKDELLSYPLGGAIIYRDGFVFRFKGASMPGGFDPSAVFFVSDGKVRPIDSASTYMKLFNEGKNDSSAWDKIYWIPKDLLEEFTYPKGENITSSQVDNGQLPNGLVVKTKDNKVAIVKDGKLSEITDEALFQNRYTTNNKIFENNLISNVDESIISKVKKGPTISSKDNSLLAVKSIDLTMLPIEEDTSSNTGSTGTNTGTGTTTDTSSVINTTPLTPTDVIPVSKVSEDPFTLTSVLMASDSDKIINIVFNKNVQNTSARNRANYTFKKLDGTVLNSSTGGSRIDSFGHPLVTPVRSSSDNKKVTITLGTVTEYNSRIPAGTYQLCISNIKTATGGDILPTTCKQFNVSSTIRPTLYWNSSSFEMNKNYMASSKKILIKYSEKMGNSAIAKSTYKIRDFDSSGYGITTWTSLSYISGVTTQFLNDNHDVLISFPNDISLKYQETDISVGDSSNMSYVPKDENGNLFIETNTNSTSLTVLDINIYTSSIDISYEIDSMEIESPTQIAVTFARPISTVSASDFRIINFANTPGFDPISASIDPKNYKKVIFTIASGYGNEFSSSDNGDSIIVKLKGDIAGDGLIYSSITKDIVGLPLSYTDDGFANQAYAYVNNINAAINSFVLASPNSLYLKLSGSILTDYEYNDYRDIANDIIIQQGNDIYINGISGSWSPNAWLSEHTEHSYGSMIVYGGGSGQMWYKPNDIVKILFSPSVDMNSSVSLKTVNKDSIATLGTNYHIIGENNVGITNSKFAAYSLEKGFFGNLYSGAYGSGYGTNINNKIVLRTFDPGSLNFSFEIEDDESAPCYDEDFNVDTDYFSPKYYRIVNDIAKHISMSRNGDIYECKLSCDADGSTYGYGVYMGLLKDSIENYYSQANNFLKMDYPYHYADKNLVEYSLEQPFYVESAKDSIDTSGGTVSYYTIKAGVDNFLSIRFNGKVDLNTLSNGGWITEDGVSYGKTINESLIFNSNDSDITFNGINIGEFNVSGDSSYIDGNILPLDILYKYDYSTNILSINIINSEHNQSADDNTTKIYLNDIEPRGDTSDGFIRYIPSSSIKNNYGYGIDINMTPYANLR